MTFRWGLLARSEDRGLGLLSREWARHMEPDRTLVIRPDAAHDAGLPMNLQWFDAPTVVPYRGRGLPETLMREWLDGLDAVVSFETMYGWEVCDWARDAGAVSILMLMPEYHGMGRGPSAPEPDVYWAPTRWRLDHLPAGTRVVEVPIPIDRWPDPDLTVGDVPRWLHVAGAPYPVSHDRNGTRAFLAALKDLRGEHRVTIRSQGLQLPVNGVGDGVHVEVHTRGVEDYWQLYADADGLVLPRRYGGLSLPALEAMGAGLALVMPTVPPQSHEWPIVRVPAELSGEVRTSAGAIPCANVSPLVLASVMNEWPRYLAECRQISRAWAEAHSWERLRPTIVAELERACG